MRSGPIVSGEAAPVYPFERFSENAKRVLTFAQEEAERSRRSYIGTEHLVLGIMRDREGIGGRALLDLGVDEARLRKDIETETASSGESILKQIVPTARVKHVIELSFDEARREGGTHVGTEHLLLAVLAEGDSPGRTVLAAQGVTAERARHAIERVRGSGIQERAHPTHSDPRRALTSPGLHFERFTEIAKKVLTMAQEEAERSHHSFVGTEHILLGLIREDGGLAAGVLNNLGVELNKVRAAIDAVLGRNERVVIQEIIPTSRVKRVIEIAFEEAGHMGNNYVGTKHLLLGLLIEGEGVAAHVLEDLGATLVTVREEIDRLRGEGIEEAEGGDPSAAPSELISSLPFSVKHRQLTVDDAQGRSVRVDLILPAAYSDGECDAAVARVRDAIRRGDPT